MRWPSIADISSATPLPDGYRFELLKRSDIAGLTEAIKVWHPDISVGLGSCFVREDFYVDKVFLDGEAEKDFIVVLIRRGDELAGMYSLEREWDALTLYARLLVIAREHRGGNWAVTATAALEKMGRAMGAGFIYGMATLKIPHMQIALEHAGFRLLGFVPGYDRELVAPGVVKRVYEAVYAKVLVPDEELLRPDPKNLTPRTRELFELLFPL